MTWHQIGPDEVAPTRELTIHHGGAKVPAFFYAARRDGPAPCIVIAPEALGMNAFTGRVATRLAGDGYAVLVVDYYRGNGPAPENRNNYDDFTEVLALIDELDFVGGTHDVLAGTDLARTLPGVDPDRIVVSGYCTGGTLAMLAASLDRRLAGAILFFPSQPTFRELTPKRPLQPIDLLWNVACPMLVIYGELDSIAPPEMLDAVRQRFAQWGIDGDVAVYPDAGHAFSAPHPPRRNDAADRASWADAMAFLQRHVG